MNNISRSMIPWGVMTHSGTEEIDYSDIEAFLGDFREVDVFAFLGVPGESRQKYINESMDMLLELDTARKVFAPEDYRKVLEEELRGLKVHYHTPESRKEELKNISEEADDLERMIAPTIDYTVARNYFEASKVFDGLQTPEDNKIVDFESIRHVDGSLKNYLLADLGLLFDTTGSQASMNYSINDSDILFPGVQYSEEASDYFGKFFFSPKSEAVRILIPQDVKDLPKKFLDFEY